MFESVDAFVTGAAVFLLVILVIALVGAAVRMIVGPGYADRFIALDMLTGLAVAACALTAAVTLRREFLDVGLGVALIAFLATVALASFLEKKERKP
jgi:multicomponent Na+:H+ antiporter subunit F